MRIAVTFTLFLLFSTSAFSQQTSVDTDASVLSAIRSLLLEESGSDVQPPDTEEPGFAGRVSLPAGVFAPLGGITFEIATSPIEFYQDAAGQFLSTRTTVTIPIGSNSAFYRIFFPTTPVFDDYRLEVNCLSGCNTLEITTNGFWSASNGISTLIDADLYSANDKHDVDILLEDADIFSGRVFFGNAIASFGTEQIVVRISSTTLLNFGSYVQYLYPESGEAASSFYIGVPTDGTADDWEISVTCNDCRPSIDIADQYPTTQGGNPLTTDENLQASFESNMNHEGLEMTFLPAE